MLSTITTNLIWTESLWLVIGLGLLAAVGWLFFKPLTFIALILFVFCFYFFRNPDRICPEALADPNVIVCPADGTIVAISPDKQKVSIFLSPLNVHVNWTPVAGVIEQIIYVPGKFMMAFLPKSSELNEHNDLIIRHASGKKILVRQIAGTVARRIVCWAKPHETVAAGQKYGMIKFSSRVDVVLPEGSILSVEIGQKVYGGKTVLGRLV